MKRIFIAIPASSEIIEQIHAFRSENPQLPVVWARDNNLHITLIPPKEMDEQQESETRRALAHCLAEGVFTIHLNKISFGPNEGEPRLLWATGDNTPELLQLKTTIEECIGYVPDRDFLLHITLGRLSHDAPDSHALESFDQKVHLKMKVDHYAAVESKQTPDGPEYTILEEFPI